MLYVSIDIETTGLIPEKCNVIQFGAVLEDTEKNLPINELPKYEVLLEWNEYRADSTWALRQHVAIWDKLETYKNKSEEEKEKANIIKPWELGESFQYWLLTHGVIEKKTDPINVAGKNFAAFDWRHLEHVPNFFKHIKFSSRIIDPAMLYWNPKEDKRTPSLGDCLKRAGMEKEIEHTAVADALDVIKVIRYKTLLDDLVYSTWDESSNGISEVRQILINGVINGSKKIN